MSDLVPASYPCQKVMGPGELCMEPCEPGFVLCKGHRNGNDRRQLMVLLEESQTRVLRRVESALDGAVEQLIELAMNARNESTRLSAIDKLLTLGGFANVRIDAQGGAPLDPSDRDKALLAMIMALKGDQEKIDELERKRQIIDVESHEPERPDAA